MSLPAFLTACNQLHMVPAAVIAAAARDDTHLFLVAALFLRDGHRGPTAAQHGRRALLWFVRFWPCQARVVALLQALPRLSEHCWDDFVLVWNKCREARPAVADVALNLYACTLRRKTAGHEQASAALPALHSRRNRHGFVESLMRYQPAGPRIEARVAPFADTAVSSLAGTLVLVDSGVCAHEYALRVTAGLSRVLELDMAEEAAVDTAGAAAVILMTPRSLHGGPPALHALVSRLHALGVPLLYWETVHPVWGDVVVQPQPGLVHALGRAPYTLDYALAVAAGAPRDEMAWLRALAGDARWAAMAVPSHGLACCVQ